MLLTITKPITRFVYNGPEMLIDDAPFNERIKFLRKINDGGSGEISYRAGRKANSFGNAKQPIKPGDILTLEAFGVDATNPNTYFQIDIGAVMALEGKELDLVNQLAETLGFAKLGDPQPAAKPEPVDTRIQESAQLVAAVLNGESVPLTDNARQRPMANKQLLMTLNQVMQGLDSLQTMVLTNAGRSEADHDALLTQIQLNQAMGVALQASQLANQVAGDLRLQALEAKDLLIESATAANRLDIEALDLKAAALGQNQLLAQAQQTASDVRLVVVEQRAFDTKAQAELNAANLVLVQARQTADSALISAAQARVDAANQANTAMAGTLSTLQNRLATAENALALAQQTFASTDAKASAAQSRADAAFAKAEADALASTAARTAADAAQATATSAQAAVLQLQYNQLYVERSFKQFAAIATGATVPTGVSVEVKDPAGRPNMVFVLDQWPLTPDVSPTLATTITLKASSVTGNVFSRLLALNAVQAVGSTVDMIAGQPKPVRVPLPATFTSNATAGTFSGPIIGHIEPA